MTQPRYSKEYRERSAAEKLPMVTFDIIYPSGTHSHGVKRSTIQGLLSDETTEDIMNRVSAAGLGTSGASLIAAERRKQLVIDGWTAAHDDIKHTQGQLANAAAYLAATREGHPPSEIGAYLTNKNSQPRSDDDGWTEMRIKHLTIAGALIAAEIDRLTRKRIANRQVSS